MVRSGLVGLGKVGYGRARQGMEWFMNLIRRAKVWSGGAGLGWVLSGVVWYGKEWFNEFN